MMVASEDLLKYPALPEESKRRKVWEEAPDRVSILHANRQPPA